MIDPLWSSTVLPKNKHICFDYTSICTLYNQLLIPHVSLSNYLNVPIFVPVVGFFDRDQCLSPLVRKPEELWDFTLLY